MGGFKKPKPDNSAKKIALENQRRAAEEAQKAEEKKKAIEEAEKKRKANIAASGRGATILAGENEGGGKTLLGG